MSVHFFAPCPRGLEATLAAELSGLNASEVKTTDGGVHFTGSFETAYRVNLWSRIASRILWRVSTSTYRNEQDIYDTTHALHWDKWFDVSRTLRVKVTAIKCPLKSLEFVTLRIKDAICDKFRESRGRGRLSTRASRTCACMRFSKRTA